MIGIWRRRLWLDLVLGAIISGVAELVSPKGLLHSGDPGSLYIAAVTSSAAFGAFAVTPIAIVLALAPGPRLKALLNTQMDAVRRAMAWAVILNVVAVGIGVFGIAVDSNQDPEAWLRYISFALELAGLLAVARLVWFFVSLLHLQRIDGTTAERPKTSTGS
jgi:hypothetical protein